MCSPQTIIKLKEIFASAYTGVQVDWIVFDIV